MDDAQTAPRTPDVKGASGGRVGPLFRDEEFTHPFPARGRPAWSPAGPALVPVPQFVEGLTDSVTGAARGELPRSPAVVRSTPVRQTRPDLLDHFPMFDGCSMGMCSNLLTIRNGAMTALARRSAVACAKPGRLAFARVAEVLRVIRAVSAP
ncbi:hypothetical protein [Streptomyces sp. NPDC003710]